MTNILKAPVFLCSLAAFLIIAALAQAQETPTSDVLASQNVIRDQIQSFQSRNHERAFSHAAPSIKKIFRTTDNFISMVKNGYGALYAPQSYSFARSRNQNGTIYQEVLATDGNGKTWQAVYTLQKQDDGSWKITGVKMEPYQDAST